MAVPDYETLMLPVLRLTAEGVARVPDLIPRLAAEFGLSDEDVSALLPSGRAPLLANRAHWARFYLSKAGLVRAVRRGQFEATEAGRALLARRPERIDKGTLAPYPEFVAWKQRSADGAALSGDGLSAPEMAPDASQAATPEEAIDRAAAEIDAALAEDLLARILERPPAFFERLVLDLLRAMGYGRGRSEAARWTGRPGDGGIDGIIHEDALGLDAVYIQAKRYDPANRIARPAIQQFVGSMTGEGATKGVFVTTSSFSAEARAYLARVQQRVVLIDGRELARLMIANEIGVRARRTYVLRSIDEDFFVEP